MSTGYPHIEEEQAGCDRDIRYATGHLGTTMRVMGPDLAILSAERYDDGLRAQRAASHGPATATKRAPGKRARKQPSVDQDEPDEKKRARGRPRLDTTDQTPQEAGVPPFIPMFRPQCCLLVY